MQIASGMIAYVEIATPWGGDTFYLTPIEAARYKENPGAFFEEQLGLSAEEYELWIRLDGRPLCGGITTSSKPCRQRVGPHGMGPGAWKASHLSELCPWHKGS